MTTVSFYTSRPAVVFEVQWTGDNLSDIQEVVTDATVSGTTLSFHNMFGDVLTVEVGDWVQGSVGSNGNQSSASTDPSYSVAPNFQSVTDAGPFSYTVTE